MTTIDENAIIVERDARLLPGEGNGYVPQQLTEVNELLNSINRRLEDCALEWQAEISRKQWKIFNSKALGENSLEQTLLSRTYFTNKALDEAFQHLLSCNKIFSEYLRNFIGLLRGERPVPQVKETCDAQNQCSDALDNWKLLSNGDNETVFPSLINSQASELRRPSNLIENMSTVQNSFADVIRAKVNFDTKFLGFEAVLHKTTSTSADGTCLCQYCSNIMKTGHEGHRKLRNISIEPRNRTIRRKTRRLTRSAKSLSRKREKVRSTLQIGDTGDQSSFGANTSFC